jgi:TPR repeat protein|tara:strand:+ start:526 stop:735 length:210 start_codon:yes stop_codon:yes gene_type:complete
MNNPKALLVLGRLYEEGLGTKKDRAKALAYYEYASQHHEPYALYKIGMFLEEGIHHQCIDGQPMREQAL